MMNGSVVNKQSSIKQMKKSKTTYERFLAVGTRKAGANELVATSSRNCEFRSGKLCCGTGIRKYYLPYAPDVHLNNIPEIYGEALKFFALPFQADGVKKDTLMVETSKNELFVFDEARTDLKILDSLASGWKAEEFVDENGNKKAYVTTDLGAYIYDPVTAKGAWVLRNTQVADACFYHERIFLGVGTTLKYSAPFAVTDFNESTDDGGYIELPVGLGEIVAIEKLGEELFVFLNRGIIKLIASGEARNFTLETLTYSGSDIIGETVCRYEDYIYFICRDGLRRFDGNKVKEIGRSLELSFKEGTRRHVAFDGGKLYLTYTDKNDVKRTVFFEIADEQNRGETFLANGLSYSQGVAFCSVLRSLSRLDPNGELPTGEEYLFKVENLEFEKNVQTYLRSIVLNGSGDCEVVVSSESGTVSKNFSLGEKGRQSVDFSHKGESFDLTIKLKKGCEIERICFETERVLGG